MPTWGNITLIGLVVLHLLAIAYYTLVRRKTLVRPMLHGDKAITGVPASRDEPLTRVAAALVLAACAAAGVVGGGAGHGVKQHRSAGGARFWPEAGLRGSTSPLHARLLSRKTLQRFLVCPKLQSHRGR